MRYVVKIFVVHFLIITSYLSITFYEFIKSQSNDPFGISILQFLLAFAYLFITGITLKITSDKFGKKNLTRKIALNFIVIILLFLAYVFFGTPIWNWVWQTKGGVMQTN